MNKEQLQNTLAVLEMAYYGPENGNTINRLKQLQHTLNVAELKSNINEVTQWLLVGHINKGR